MASWFSLEGRFPALAVFGLPALIVAVGLVVLWGLIPWQGSSDDPPIPLGIETAVGGGQALPSVPATRVAAGVAVPVGPGVQTAQRVSGGAGLSPAPNLSSPAVAPAQVIAVAEAPSSPVASAPESATGEEVPSVGTTAGEVPPEGTSSPVAVPGGASGGASGGPVTAGVVPAPENCEGDEYLIAIVPSTEVSGEDQSVEIILTRFNEDGSTEELSFEGDLLDAQGLALQLSSEGNCVHLETGTAPEGGTPSGGTSPVVVPTEGVPPSAIEPGSEEPAAPDSP